MTAKKDKLFEFFNKLMDGRPSIVIEKLSKENPKYRFFLDWVINSNWSLEDKAEVFYLVFEEKHSVSVAVTIVQHLRSKEK